MLYVSVFTQTLAHSGTLMLSIKKKIPGHEGAHTCSSGGVLLLKVNPGRAHSSDRYTIKS